MGFPHSEIFGSKCAGNSPKLIAACHVLHRLSVPRHPPNALIVLNFTFCQRNDDLAIVIRLVPCRGRPPHQTALIYPFLPLCLGDRARNIRLSKTSSSDKRCQRTNSTPFPAYSRSMPRGAR